MVISFLEIAASEMLRSRAILTDSSIARRADMKFALMYEIENACATLRRAGV